MKRLFREIKSVSPELCNLRYFIEYLKKKYPKHIRGFALKKISQIKYAPMGKNEQTIRLAALDLIKDPDKKVRTFIRKKFLT